MLSVAMIMMYNCRATTSHPFRLWFRTGSTMHFAQNRGSQKTGDSRDIENSTVAYSSSCDRVYCTPSAYELNRPLGCKVKYIHRIIGKMSVPFVWCSCMPESCHLLVFASNAESVNLTLGNDIQNVQIDHSESEMKEIHCSCQRNLLCLSTMLRDTCIVCGNKPSHDPSVSFHPLLKDSRIKEQNSLLCFWDRGPNMHQECGPCFQPWLWLSHSSQQNVQGSGPSLLMWCFDT